MGAGLVTWGRIAIGFALFVGVVTGTSVGLYRYVSTSPRFAIKHVVISGAQHRTEDDLKRIAGVTIGKNVFQLDLDEARRALLADPWIERANVERKLPGTVRIEVTEREPVCEVVVGDGLYLAGAKGDVFKRLEPGDPADLVVVTGPFSEAGMLRDRDGTVALVARAEDVIADWERLGPATRWPLEEVHVADDGSIEIVVGQTAVALSLGKPPYRPKIERGARVLAEIDRRKGQPSVIFLDNEAHPERVVARMR